MKSATWLIALVGFFLSVSAAASPGDPAGVEGEESGAALQIRELLRARHPELEGVRALLQAELPGVEVSVLGGYPEIPGLVVRGDPDDVRRADALLRAGESLETTDSCEISVTVARLDETGAKSLGLPAPGGTWVSWLRGPFMLTTTLNYLVAHDFAEVLLRQYGNVGDGTESRLRLYGAGDGDAVVLSIAPLLRGPNPALDCKLNTGDRLEYYRVATGTANVAVLGREGEGLLLADPRYSVVIAAVTIFPTPSADSGPAPPATPARAPAGDRQ